MRLCQVSNRFELEGAATPGCEKNLVSRHGVSIRLSQGNKSIDVPRCRILPLPFSNYSVFETLPRRRLDHRHEDLPRRLVTKCRAAGREIHAAELSQPFLAVESIK